MGSVVIFSRKGKGEEIISRGDRDILPAARRVAHGGSMESLAGVEVPQRFARLAVYGFKRRRIVCKEDQPRCGRHDSTPGVPVALLRIFPPHPIRAPVKSKEVFP